MLTKALLVRLEALPGKESELAEFLKGARAIVMDEPGTVAWFAIQFSPSTFGVYDVFPDDESRDAHLAGGVGQRSDRTPVSSSLNLRSRRSTFSPRRSRDNPRRGSLGSTWWRACAGPGGGPDRPHPPRRPHSCSLRRSEHLERRLAGWRWEHLVEPFQLRRTEADLHRGAVLRHARRSGGFHDGEHLRVVAAPRRAPTGPGSLPSWRPCHGPRGARAAGRGRPGSKP